MKKFVQSFPASGCGTVGRVVASDTRDPQFESQHRQLSISNVHICQLQFRKDENKEREAGIGTLKKSFPARWRTISVFLGRT